MDINALFNGYLLCAVLVLLVGIFLGKLIATHNRDARDDEDQLKYLNKWNEAKNKWREAKRARKGFPTTSRKKSD